jgi:beta-1,4-mannosyltransferase
MQYHAEALAARGVDVDVVACAGSALHAEIRNHPRITCHLLPSGSDHVWPRLLRLPAAAVRAVLQALRLVWVFLVVLRKPDVILVQNPPAIPTLLVTVAVARLRGARLVIDWHNLAWAVLALGAGARNPVIPLARWYEHALGRRADAHLAVSEALRATLAGRWGLRDVTVLRDRPAARFAPLAREAREPVRERLTRALGLGGRRPALVVSPTSWTADEDFDLLLEAVHRCEALVRDRVFPDVLVLLTGRGASRRRFEAAVAALPGRRIHVRTLWLEPDDYPGTLGAADLGLCLHRSASGLDLPMKIADMHGAGLPVCALDYGPCLDEMLRHGEGGLRFADAATLARQWVELLGTFPTTPRLDHLRAGVDKARAVSWQAGWDAEARKVLLPHA